MPLRMFKQQSLYFKIVISVLVYITVVGITGNVFLYLHLQAAVSRKSERLDRAYLEAVGRRLARNLEDVFSLAVICVHDPLVQAVSRQDRTEVILNSLAVQDRFNAFVRANPMSAYIDKLILFDDRGLFVQAQARQPGESGDPDNIRQLPLYSRFTAGNLFWTSGFGRSIGLRSSRHCYSLLMRARGTYYNSADSYLYVEIGLDWITGVLGEYGFSPGVFVRVNETGQVIFSGDPVLAAPGKGDPGYVPQGVSFPYRFRQGGRTWRLDQLPLENGLISLYNQADVTSLAADDRQILYTALGTALFLVLAVGGFITGRFLIKIKEQYREQRNTEFALLQTKINPHFLYNTLDSIQWMAKIQGNPSIADISRRLVSLLRNIVSRDDSGGGDAKITLAGELRILEDYTELMSVRFMGGFEVINRVPPEYTDCLIPKFTLQPLVENSILHGIVPSASFVAITLGASINGEFLDITVEDNGPGMSQEQLESIKARSRSRERGGPSLNNIGIDNVDERLKLLYGESCGLFFESRRGSFTKVTVRIIKER